MAYIGNTSVTNNNEQLGAFSGYIRRNENKAAGVTAQIFGENGDDADTILALSLSKYVDAEVFVNIYLIKDPDGKIMKEGDSYPLISSFVAYVKRSQPKKDGMVAQFYSPNSIHSDAMNELNKSSYQDSLVFVDVRGVLANKEKDKINQESNEKIDHEYINKITKAEKVEIQKKEKQFKKMNEQIEYHEFLSRIEVLTSLGSGQEFKEWIIRKHTCAHSQEKPCLNDSDAVSVLGLVKPFNYLPCCSEHSKELSDITEVTEKDRHYYEIKHLMLMKQWAWNVMRQQFSHIGSSEPDPAKVIEWAASKNLSRYLPIKYQPI